MLKKYNILSNEQYFYGDFSLKTITSENIESIREWRNEQMSVLRQFQMISSQEQKEYFENNIWPTMAHQQPREILLLFLLNEDPVGYGGLVNISWDNLRAEVSFLSMTDIANHDEKYSIHFSSYLKIIKEIAFEDLGLKRIFTETYSFRKKHIAILESCGFVYEGCLVNHNCIDGQQINSLIHGCLDSYER